MQAYNDNSTTVELDRYGDCPECGSSWDAGDIFPVLRKQDWCKHLSDEQLQAKIEVMYGPPPHKFSRIVGVELAYNHPQHYDGVSFWRCPDCKKQWHRFKPQPKTTQEYD